MAAWAVARDGELLITSTTHLDKLLVAAHLPVALHPVAVGLEEVWLVLLLAHVARARVAAAGGAHGPGLHLGREGVEEAGEVFMW
jgi:hypothetical protein